MKYRNAGSILPPELTDEIQKYVQGEYIYIPKKNTIKETQTEYKVELQKRDRHIYVRALEGVSKKRLSDMYNLSESSIRRIIINQRKRYETMEERIKETLNEWNIENCALVQIYDTAWQVGSKYILKVYKNGETLERNVRINAVLDSMGIPVGRTVLTKDSKAYVQEQNYFFHLSERLHGQNVVSIRSDQDIAFKMGRIIAELHCAFRKCEAHGEFWQNSLHDEMNGWIRESLEISGWRFISKSRFDETLRCIEEVYNELPAQLIHRDVHFGNFLFDKGRFSGYIDFDLSQKNIRIFDLCYFALSVLSEKEKLEVTEEAWFDVLRDVFAGYQSVLRLSEKEIFAVPYVMEAIEMLFVAWYTEQDEAIEARRAVKICDFVESDISRIIRNIQCSSEEKHLFTNDQTGLI